MRTFSLSDETWDSLLAPISEEAPSGEALRYEGTYDRVIEMRRQDRADLPQGVWEHSLKTADWEKIEATCVSALAEKSKDYQIAFWLTEAWFNRYGLEGFQRGIQLVHELVHPVGVVRPQVRGLQGLRISCQPFGQMGVV